MRKLSDATHALEIKRQQEEAKPHLEAILRAEYARALRKLQLQALWTLQLPWLLAPAEAMQ